MEIVRIEVPVGERGDSATKVGLRDGVMPRGVVFVSETVPLNPLTSARLIEVEVEVPATSVREDGFAEILKSDTFTVTLMF